MSSFRCLPVVLLAALLLWGTASRAADGSLDPSFGGGGRVTTAFGAAGAGVLAMVLQPDGKIVAAGHVGWGGLSFGSFAFARYQANGSLDTTFGTGGKVTVPVPGGGHARGLIRQPDGKLLALGNAYLPPTAGFALVRLEADGSLDTGFGNGGVALVTMGSGSAFDAVVLSDGKILVAGGVSNSAGLTYDAALARFNADGTPDASFGSGGLLVVDLGYGEFYERLAMLPDESGFYVSGEFYRPGPGRYGYDGDFFVARHLADGTLDASFGGGGFVTTDFGGEYHDFQYVTGLALQPDGKVLISGPVGNFAGLARYAPDGSLDPSFGDGGTVLLSSFGPGLLPRDLALEPDGRIVVAGAAERGPEGTEFGFTGGPYEFGLVRLLPDGSVDTTLAACPQVTTSFPGVGAIGEALARDADGQYVVAGRALDGTEQFALVRYGTSDTPLCQPAAPRKSKAKITDGASVNADRFGWSWVGAGALTAADLGDPTSTTGYTLCAIEDGVPPRLELGGPVLRVGWTAAPSGFRLKSKAPAASPISQVAFRIGGPGKGKIKLKAMGEYLAPTLPLSTPVTVRLVRDGTPVCWEATFDAGVTRNDAGKFVAKSN